MRNKHHRKPRCGTADKKAITLRKAVRKGRALCAVCGKNHADMFYDGVPIASEHLHIIA